MSEQKLTYMQQLDAWTDQDIIEPLADDGFVAGVETSLQIRRAIREKVLESYKNGLRSGAGAVRKEAKHAQAQTR